MKSKFFFLLFVSAGLLSFNVHKYYLSLTQIKFKEEQKSVQIIINVFMDDIELALNKDNNIDLQLTTKRELKSNDVYFDLAALVVSFGLNESQQLQLLKNYQSRVCEHREFNLSLEKLAAFHAVFLLLCICWYEQRGAMDKVAPLLTQLNHFIEKVKN